MLKTPLSTKYLQLEGIRVLSSSLYKQLEELVLATADITGEKLDESNYGLAADFIWTPEETVKDHLKKLDILIK